MAKSSSGKKVNKSSVKKAKRYGDKESEKVVKVDKKIDVKVNKPSNVQKGHVVGVHYVGTLDNGEEFDNSTKNGPIRFVAGQNQVIKGFDEAVLGMKINEEKKFRIERKDAYGDINPQLTQKVPMDKLPPELKSQVKVGGFLVLQSPTGQQVPAKVHSMDKDSIILDLNHPLAGKDLNFKIKIVDISTHDPKLTQHDHADGKGHDHSGHDHSHGCTCEDGECTDDCCHGDCATGDCCEGECDCEQKKTK